MKRHLPLLGSLLALGALATALTFNRADTPVFALLGAGALCLGGGALLQGGRIGNAWSNLKAVVYVLLVAGCLVFLQGLALPRLPSRDLTSVRLNTLTELTRAFLSGLETPVEFTAFTYQREEFTRFFERLRAERPEMISYRLFDPFSDVDEALEFAETVLPDDIFVRVGGRQERTSGLDEGGIVNALVAALSNRPRTVYFLTGHGELSLKKPARTDDAGRLRSVSTLVELLRERRYDVGVLELPRSRAGAGAPIAVPADAACVVAMGPTLALPPEEAQALFDYLSGGGRMIFAIGHDALRLEQGGGDAVGGWREIAAEMGVRLGSGVVLDALGQQLHNQALAAVPGALANRQPIDADNTSYHGLLFQQSRDIASLDPAPPGTNSEPILYSSPLGVVRELSELNTGTLSIGEGDVDYRPLVIRAARQFVENEEIARARMFFFAASSPFIDAQLDHAAARMFLSAVDQISSELRDEMLPIPPRILPDQSLAMTREQYRFLLILHILFIPGVIFFGGMGLTLRRRWSA